MRLPRGIQARLLLSHLVVVLVAIGTVLVAVDLVGPGYFAERMGHRPGDPMAAAMDTATLEAFGSAVRTALVAATVIALTAAVALALALSTRIAMPITHLAAAARRIASGHYAERVDTLGDSELRALSASFNAMATSLETTERRRLVLVGDVAHELRTPLTTLDGYLEGLQDGVVVPSETTWTLLRQETGRLARLVNDLSELWRAEARQLPLRIETVDAATVVREVVERHGPAAAERRIRLDLRMPERLLVLADRDRVAQILTDFLSNAVRYAPETSVVTIDSQCHAYEVRIAVRDEGPGLTGDQARRVFERFYRIDPSRSRALGGSGIGLPIARAVAEAMDGRTWAESEGPGTGSTFWVALPAA